MTKLSLLSIFIAGILFSACTVQDIPVFGDEHILYFEKFWTDAGYPGKEKADSTEATFFFLEDDVQSMKVDLRVVLGGRKLEKDLKFKLRSVDELTTALPEEYTLEETYTFRALPILENAKQIQDTIQIQFNRSKRLETLEKGYRLVLEIMPDNSSGEPILLGQKERTRAIIHISKDPVKPEWWTKEIEIELLGTYSPLKYKLFLRNVPDAYKIDKEFIQDNPNEARKIALDFKKWLIENPQTENGEPMEVPV